jgi:hypothetical protein
MASQVFRKGEVAFSRSRCGIRDAAEWAKVTWDLEPLGKSVSADCSGVAASRFLAAAAACVQ